MKYTHIIWDWNGTLLDDISASLASVNDMLERRGMQHIDIKRYKECIGVPISKFYERVFDLSKEDYPRLLEEYNKGYMYHLKDCNLSDGAEELIDYFAACGAKQAIVSSSNNVQLQQNVERFGVLECFEEVLGAADFMAESKIERAVNYLKKSPVKPVVLVIGDLEHDLEMSNTLGADCILITTGHENPERLKKSGARLISNLRELLLL